jgi:hypothetical protein
MSRFRVVVSEAIRSLGANLSTTFAATTTVLIGMFMLGLVVGLGSWALSLSDHYKKQLLVNVYFCTDLRCGSEAQNKDIDATRSALAAMLVGASVGRLPPPLLFVSGGLLLGHLLGAARAVAEHGGAHHHRRLEPLRVLGAVLGDGVLGRAQAVARGDLLQAGLPVQAGAQGGRLGQQRVDEVVHELGGGVDAGRLVDRADHRLDGVGED